MSYVQWKVVPCSRCCDGERAVAECRVSRGTAMDSDCRPQTSSVAGDGSLDNEFDEIRWCFSVETAVD